MSRHRRATHKGWFLFCPIYLRGINSPEPDVWERHAWLKPLFVLSHWAFMAWVTIRSLFESEDYEPQFPILITGRLPRRPPW